MAKEINFDEITELPLNLFFRTEDQHFTPWLQENIDKLGSIIGIDIAEAETEVSIGSFRLDILAYESGTNRKIAIENQYGTTNHTHLGQLITYMAGLNAEVVVWIAENFNTEHITAINHLNQISNKDIAFFCIKPRLITIGDSKPAIEFVVIAKPDEWEKEIHGEINLSERALAYKDFWTKLKREYQQKIPSFNRKVSTRSYYGMTTGKAGLGFLWKFTNKGCFEIELWVNTTSQTRNQEIINKIKSNKDNIENNLDCPLFFYNDENYKHKSVNIRYKKPADILTTSEKGKEELINWGVQSMPRFQELLQPIIKEF
ncbi:DUF4268 domain-containing protein [Methanobacterium sp. CWC-01]|uniref:DUF4268 domain-containing protein n=1 Tax=Methanobacterium aridiramus TaxID=2584467 RepID=UPI002578B534|nr:DUF4268 domain-containing protein [Methanobacterium sp. CWC-01]